MMRWIPLCLGYCTRRFKFSATAVPVNTVNKKTLQVPGQLSDSFQVGHQQQNQQLPLTPASLQLAQLQAQLSLHLTTGSNTTTTASVLIQVLSNVAMAQPLFNQLRNPQTGFPTGVFGFSTSNSALMAGGFNQNPENIRLVHHTAGTTISQQGVEFGKNVGPTYSSDIDKHLQYNLGGTTTASSPAAQAKLLNNAGYKQEFYGRDITSLQAELNVSNHNIHMYNCTGQTEQWNSPASTSNTVNGSVPSDVAAVWPATGQAVRCRNELYNPEEPTTDHKFKPKSGVLSCVTESTQGFGSYQPRHGNEETLCSGVMTLQPYQVNDYHAVTPTQLPHQCSICDKKVYNLKDWDQHVKGKLHLQNRMLYSNESMTAVSARAPNYTLGRPGDEALNGGESMNYATANKDILVGVNFSHLPASAMKTYPLPNTGFTSHQPESKPFLPRKATIGRVVHICNLPEGSCTENDVINLGLPFGKVTNYILMRSTQQAFLEMAYAEAAQAMVQYYQLTPAMINNQKLLIRMSKRYQELQLKKPGKDVQAIIQDIASHWERDQMQELEHYMPDRARSRSPVRSSLSPQSHSPSFTSCSSTHSPQEAHCRAHDRDSSGPSPHQGSWDWSSHYKRGEDDKETDEPCRWNSCSTNSDWPNERPSEQWKAYEKPLDYSICRPTDEQGRDKGMPRKRDFTRGSPLVKSFNSYWNAVESHYIKVSRAPYPRHDSKSKRRSDSDHSRHSKQLDSDMIDEPLRTAEDKKYRSPSRGRTRKPNKRCTTTEKHDSPMRNTDDQSKEHVSPQDGHKPTDAAECLRHTSNEKALESEENTDDECCYPKNMEEFLTVDEVGEDDLVIIEPDLPELEENADYPEVAKKQTQTMVETLKSPSVPLEERETYITKFSKEQTCENAEIPAETFGSEKTIITETIVEVHMQSPVTSEQPLSKPSHFPNEEFHSKLGETSAGAKVSDSGPLEEHLVNNHIQILEHSKVQDVVQVTEASLYVPQNKGHSILKKDIEKPSSVDQEKLGIEHIIPLGVEFIEPRAGFFCKLCELFYTNEEIAKTSHCRSPVHYRNLQIEIVDR
ncbi:RNA-binding protein 20 isoform X2 [Stigmatopora argus]